MKKINLIPVAIFAFAFIFFISCNKKDIVLISDNISYSEDNILYSDVLENNIESDDFFLNSTQRQDSLLFVEVSYSGGCSDHSFMVIWDGIIYESNPPQANIIISHDANGDACEAFLTENLVIDLKQVFNESYSNDLKLIILNGSEK